MAQDFRLADLSDADPATWPLLSSYIERAGKLADPDWTFFPFQESVLDAEGNPFGRGFPSATWKWNVLADWQREALRAMCPSPALHTKVYIRTPTNETTSGARVWGDFLADMIWPRLEDKSAGYVGGLILEFRNLIPVASP